MPDLEFVQEGSIITALSRIAATLPQRVNNKDTIQSLSVHANPEGVTYECSEEVSAHIRDIYNKIDVNNKTFLTVTQGINEVTIVAEAQVAATFRIKLRDAAMIYDKRNLAGITVKFALEQLQRNI